jgi:hypothetical protein
VTRTPSLLTAYRKLTSAQRALAVQEGKSRWYRERVIDLQPQVRVLEEAAKREKEGS